MINKLKAENANLEADLKAAHEEIGRLRARLERAAELPFVAMINQQLDDKGKMDKSKAEQSKNGRYAVVYVDKTLWKIPLIDVCSRNRYRSEFAEARLKELEGGE